MYDFFRILRRPLEEVCVKGVRPLKNLGTAGEDAAAGPVTPAIGYEVVRRGSTGEWVSKLQKALAIKADGDFGPETEAVLKAFQGENALEPDGIAGRNIYRALGLIS